MRLELDQVVLQRAGINLAAFKIDFSGITVLLGPNASGKSSFLGLIHGRLRADLGNVLWEGVSASETREKRGIMLQTNDLLNQSARNNLVFAGRMLGLGPKETMIRADYFAERLGIARALLLAFSCAALSGGERAKLAFLRALLGHPSMLLLDEPTAALDPQSTDMLERYIRKLAGEDNTPVLFSTHDIAQARRMAQQIIFIHEGQILYAGDSSEFWASEHHFKNHEHLGLYVS